jgi:hypothetical protein
LVVVSVEFFITISYIYSFIFILNVRGFILIARERERVTVETRAVRGFAALSV